MGIKLGNLVTFKRLGDEKQMVELEEKLRKLGYENESNCKENTNTGRLTWHIYDMPRVISFSVLTDEVVKLLKKYSSNFHGRVAVVATKLEDLTPQQ